MLVVECWMMEGGMYERERDGGKRWQSGRVGRVVAEGRESSAVTGRVEWVGKRLKGDWRVAV
jgi:hypothetical protein